MIGIGRVTDQGPSVVSISDDLVFDVTAVCPTVAHWLSGRVSIDVISSFRSIRRFEIDMAFSFRLTAH